MQHWGVLSRVPANAGNSPTEDSFSRPNEGADKTKAEKVAQKVKFHGAATVDDLDELASVSPNCLGFSLPNRPRIGSLQLGLGCSNP